MDHVEAVTRPHRIKQDRVSILGARVLEGIGGRVKGRFAIMIVEYGRRNVDPWRFKLSFVAVGQGLRVGRRDWDGLVVGSHQVD